jgi:hypothetical protein
MPIFAEAEGRGLAYLSPACWHRDSCLQRVTNMEQADKVCIADGNEKESSHLTMHDQEREANS